MPGQLGQESRVAALTTPLGEDVLVLIKFHGHEGLGELFEFDIDALSTQDNIDFDKVLGLACSIKLDAYGKTRYFNGIATHAQSAGKLQDNYRYKLTLRPWLFLLGHMADCRIFLDQSVTDTIREVFTKAGFNDFEFRTTEDYEKIPYCVQYRETHLDFVCRLMEQYGIYYFFEHTESKHTLVLADSRSSLKTISDLANVPYYTPSGSELRSEQHVYIWQSARRFCTGKVTFNDYDYLQPNKNLLATAQASENYAHSKLEFYDYPGKYTEQDQGKKLAQVRLEAYQALDHRRHSIGDAGSLFPGGLTTLQNYSTGAENQEYVVVRCRHRYLGEQYRAVLTTDDDAVMDEQQRPDVINELHKELVYLGAYEFQPSSRPFRMLPLTPKPRVLGIETAKVVPKKGDEGEEISTDEYGRIWVQFYWDREPKLTCPIRVAQVWASKKWGGIFIPRVGMEVVVEFLEGDPDRPLVSGVVYNGDNKPPYDLPDNKTIAGWKTDSSKGDNGYNEFIFEDKKSSEMIRMHAEKDHDVTILNSETTEIGEKFETPRGSPSRQHTLKNGDDQLTINEGDHAIELQMGDQTITLDMGQQTVSTMQGITLTVAYGVSVITITPMSITLESPTITLMAEGEISLMANAINLAADAVNIGAVLNTPELNAAAATVSGVPV